MNATKFVNRHISLNEADKEAMLKKVGVSDIDELVSQTIPSTIRLAEHFGGLIRIRNVGPFQRIGI